MLKRENDIKLIITDSYLLKVYSDKAHTEYVKVINVVTPNGANLHLQVFQCL